MRAASLAQINFSVVLDARICVLGKFERPCASLLTHSMHHAGAVHGILVRLLT